MTRLKNLIVSAVLGLATIVPVTGAEAMPFSAPGSSVERTTDVTNARIVCGRYRCRRVYRPGRVYIAPRVIIREPRVYYRPRVIVRERVVVRPGYSRHVSWCLNRYRSYDPSTNLFVSYDGEYRVCRSPYR